MSSSINDQGVPANTSQQPTAVPSQQTNALKTGPIQTGSLRGRKAKKSNAASASLVQAFPQPSTSTAPQIERRVTRSVTKRAREEGGPSFAELQQQPAAKKARLSKQKVERVARARKRTRLETGDVADATQVTEPSRKKIKATQDITRLRGPSNVIASFLDAGSLKKFGLASKAGLEVAKQHKAPQVAAKELAAHPERYQEYAGYLKKDPVVINALLQQSPLNFQMLTPELQEQYLPNAIASSFAPVIGKSASEIIAIIANFTMEDLKKELGISGDIDTPSKKRIAERFERELFLVLTGVIGYGAQRRTPIGDENRMTEEGVIDLQNIDAYYQLLQRMSSQLRTDKQFLIELIKIDPTLLVALHADKGLEVKNPQPLGSETKAFVAACCKDRDLAHIAIDSDLRIFAIFHEDLRKDSSLAEGILKYAEAYSLAVEERLLPEALYYNQEFLLKAIQADSRFLGCIPAPFLSENHMPFLLKAIDVMRSSRNLVCFYRLLPGELQKNQDIAVAFCTRGIRMHYKYVHRELKSNSAFVVKLCEQYEQCLRKEAVCQVFCEQSREICNELLKNSNIREVLLSDSDTILYLGKNNYSIESLCSSGQTPQQLINQYPGTMLLAPQELMQDKQAVLKAAAVLDEGCSELYVKLPQSLRSDIEVMVLFAVIAEAIWFLDQNILWSMEFFNAACDLSPDLQALAISIIPYHYMQDPQFVTALFTMFAERKINIPLLVFDKMPPEIVKIARDIMSKSNMTI